MSENEFWTSASIKIISEETSVNEITMKLKIDPSRTFEKGSKVSPRNPKSSLREEHIWIFKSDIGSDIPLEKHLEKLYSILKPKKEVLEELEKSCNISLFCGYSSEKGQGGLVMSSKLLKELASLNIDLVLDLYPPEK